MPRLAAIDPSTATGQAKVLLDGVQKSLGTTPNLVRTFANSPAVLEGYLGFSGALGKGVLNAKLREQLAIVVAETNACDYCLSIHTAIGKMVGLPAEELERNRTGTSATPKTEAALVFARSIVETRGWVEDTDMEAVRAAGYTEAEIAEIVANVALNIFTNYFNHVARTDVDFPLVHASSANRGAAHAGAARAG